MEIKVNETVTYELSLNKKEALFLKEMVQNFLGQYPDDESEEVREIRMKFWNGLPSIEELRK